MSLDPIASHRSNPNTAPNPAPVLGIDGARAAWIAVRLERGAFAGCLLAPSLADILAAHPDAVAVAIDVPIGLPERDPRPADQAARAFVGVRRSSVFEVPPRVVLEAPSYPEANARSRRLNGKGLSAQSYALRDKIFEADALLADVRIHEVHPEVSFRALQGQPLEAPKKSWNGLNARRRLLAEAGIRLPDRLDCGSVAADDLLDAAVAAWSAQRIAAGTARALPESPSPDADPRIGRIWY